MAALIKPDLFHNTLHSIYQSFGSPQIAVKNNFCTFSQQKFFLQFFYIIWFDFASLFMIMFGMTVQYRFGTSN